MIRLVYETCDRYHEARKFKTLAGARRWAAKLMGPTPDLGPYYAVSMSGTAILYVEGATFAEVFPALGPAVGPVTLPAVDWEG